MTNHKKLPLGTLVLFGLFLLVMLVTYIMVRPPPRPPELEGILRPAFHQLRPFELIDHNGAVFDRKRLQKKWTFVFFGYTSCPDICPTTLYVLDAVQGQIEDRTGSAPEDMQVLFVSVDPGRDSPEVLAGYVAYFNKKFIGATAERTELDRLAAQFGASYILEEESSPGEYLVAHTSAIFLLDPLGRLVATFSQPHYASTIVSQYERILAYFYQ